MPIYEYQCADCGEKFEEIVMGDRNRKFPCPQCGSSATEKQLSVIGGIAMGGNAAPACGTSCPSASQCSGAGGCCQGG